MDSQGRLIATALALVWLAVHAPLAPAADAPAEAASQAPAAPTGENLDQLLDLADRDVSQLSKVSVNPDIPSLNTEVTTASRQPSTIGHTPAAIFVITNEMIRRSGCKEVPEVLRMVPGVEVAKIDSNKWAVTIRGRNNRFSECLLVQVDGRTVYTPDFAGVWWDTNDVLLEDVERIEVIRGPGASVWGANAVNGVINIITKSSRETLGSYGEVGGGLYERAFASARQGGSVGKDITYRVYGKWFDRGPGYVPGQNPNDDWQQGRGGFRTDYKASESDAFTLQGDYYNGYSGETTLRSQLTPPYRLDGPDDDCVAGGNVVQRWTHTFSDDNECSLQFFYDNYERTIRRSRFHVKRDTCDVDFVHRFKLGGFQKIVWGCEYRVTSDDYRTIPNSFIVDPAHRTDDLFGFFLQDTITVVDDFLHFTAGSKFEYNDYTNFEFQPTGRVLITPDERRSIWASVSRAVRTPSRKEEDLAIYDGPVAMIPEPLFVEVVPNRQASSMTLMAWELGYREQVTDAFAYDAALFYFDYDRGMVYDARGIVPGPYGTRILRTCLSNDMTEESYGFEVSATYQVTRQWRLQAAYTHLDIFPHTSPAATPVHGAIAPDPNNQVYLQSSWDLGRHWELDLIGRYVDTIAIMEVPSYIVMDVRAAYRPSKHLELAVVGRNLLNDGHKEFGSLQSDSSLGVRSTGVPASVYGQVTWRY